MFRCWPRLGVSNNSMPGLCLPGTPYHTSTHTPSQCQNARPCVHAEWSTTSCIRHTFTYPYVPPRTCPDNVKAPMRDHWPHMMLSAHISHSSKTGPGPLGGQRVPLSTIQAHGLRATHMQRPKQATYHARARIPRIAHAQTSARPPSLTHALQERSRSYMCACTHTHAHVRYRPVHLVKQSSYRRNVACRCYGLGRVVFSPAHTFP